MSENVIKYYVETKKYIYTINMTIIYDIPYINIAGYSIVITIFFYKCCPKVCFIDIDVDLVTSV